MFHCVPLYCIVLYCTVLYCTVLYCTVFYCTVLYCIVLFVRGTGRQQAACNSVTVFVSELASVHIDGEQKL